MKEGQEKDAGPRKNILDKEGPVRCQQVETHCRAPLWGQEDGGSKSRTLSQEVVRGRRKDGRGWTLNIACSVGESPPPPHHPTWDLRTACVTGKTERWRMHVRDGEREGKGGAEFKLRQTK